MRQTKSAFLGAWIVVILGAGDLVARAPVTRARVPLPFPDLPGYVTLRCDFHMHTVFSDGTVWPTVRVEEAWREGLDAIAITDHIEYQPHRADVVTNHNRSFALAAEAGRALDLLVVQGAEITRKMPPGHLNALFLTNATALVTSEWRHAVQAAAAQGAFIFWNHPGWEEQLTNGRVRWYAEHTALWKTGLLHGIEVVNGRSYYPAAHRWALQRRLAMLGTSDIHGPIQLDYLLHQGDRRPLTLVFARERSIAALKEALLDRRTVVYADSRLLGEEWFLKPIFQRSIRVLNPRVTLRGTRTAYVQIQNDCAVDFLLQRAAEPPDLTVTKELTLASGRVVLLELKARGKPEPGTRRIELPFQVTNLLVAPSRPLNVMLELEATFSR
jgi:predicted metal-dependent phosphoesterase TrpH